MDVMMTMSEEEIELIYNYLHENYRYEDGKLIRKYDNKFHKKNTAIGSFFYNCSSPYERVTLNINKKNLYFPLSHLIWLFHNKKFPCVIRYKDGNSLNSKIENIESITRVEMQHTQRKLKHEVKGYTEKKLRDGSIAYRAIISIKGKKVGLGQYKTKDEAHKKFLEAKNIVLQNTNISIEDLRKLFIVYKLPKGVYKSGNRFIARVRINFKCHYIGRYDSKEEAHAAYLKAKKSIKEHENP